MAEISPDPWMFVLEKYLSNVDDRIIFTIGLWGTNIIVFYGLNLILFIFYYYNLFPEKRINKGDLPPQSLINDCVRHNLISHFLIQPVAAYFMYPVFSYFGCIIRAPLPPISIFLRDILICIAVNDTLFYWAHRTLHHPAIYKYIHKKHHLFNYSIGIAATYAHPIEDLFANLIPTLLGSLLIGSHFIVFLIWIILRLMETIDAHSGYSFSFSPFGLLPFQGGVERHDFHHSKNVGCYGSFTIFWDSVLGTDQAFLEFQKKKQKQFQETSSKDH
jgi:sterol desaturase/sphingolipid hydroxylase (fatty acid hydroxylase superfamily)